MTNLVNQTKGKPLWEHMQEEHNGKFDPTWFKMKMEMKHRSALQRQIREALDIEGSSAEIILNKKGEWNGSRIPRIKIEVADKLDDEEKDEQVKLCENSDRQISRILISTTKVARSIFTD